MPNQTVYLDDLVDEFAGEAVTYDEFEKSMSQDNSEISISELDFSLVDDT